MKYAIVLLLLAVAVQADVQVHSRDSRLRAKRAAGVEVTLDSLSTLVQQQASTIQTLQARVTALENLELPSTFNPVAFSVRFSHDDPSGRHGVGLGAHSILQFDVAITNIGNGYDPRTGIFTAPTSGVYVLFLTMMASDAEPDLMLAIQKHDVMLDQLYAAGSGDKEDQGSTQVTTHMAAGEQVWIRQVKGSYVRGGYWTVFTGYLLQADQ